MRRLALLPALLCLLVPSAAAAGSTSQRSSAPPVVTVVGDSVAAAIAYVPEARDVLGSALTLRLDLRVCRRLVEASCRYRGRAAPTALQAVRALGRAPGSVLVVDVGYNEGPAGYAQGLDDVMRAARADGVRAVVWVTLRDAAGPYRDIYRRTNEIIRAAPQRWPSLAIADWEAYSRGRRWFRGDGLHLTPSGAVALASFLHASVVRVLGAATRR